MLPHSLFNMCLQHISEEAMTVGMQEARWIASGIGHLPPLKQVVLGLLDAGSDQVQPVCNLISLRGHELSVRQCTTVCT